MRRMGTTVIPLPEGEGEGEEPGLNSHCTLIRPSATFSLREKDSRAQSGFYAAHGSQKFFSNPLQSSAYLPSMPFLHQLTFPVLYLIDCSVRKGEPPSPMTQAFFVIAFKGDPTGKGIAAFSLVFSF